MKGPIHKKEGERGVPTPLPQATTAEVLPADNYPRQPSDVLSAATFYGGPANQVIQRQVSPPSRSDCSRVSGARASSGISQPAFKPPSPEQLPELHSFHLLRGNMSESYTGLRAVIGEAARCSLGLLPATGVALGTAIGLLGAVQIGRTIIGASEWVARAIRVALKDILA